MNIAGLIGIAIFLFFTMPIIIGLGVLSTIGIGAFAGDKARNEAVGVVVGAIWGIAYALATVGGIGYAIYYIATM